MALKTMLEDVIEAEIMDSIFKRGAEINISITGYVKEYAP
jgi:hypothetical protein